MPRTVNGVINKVDNQATHKYLKELRQKREDWKNDLANPVDEAWKEQFRQEWNKSTAKLKEVVHNEKV